MFIRALISFIILPGIAAFIAPPLLAYVDPWRKGVFWQGSPILLVGGTLLLLCVRDFYVSGKGTLAPWDPPKRLVIVGLYRFGRNPMYIGVVTLVLGWAVLLTSPVLLLYKAVLVVGFHIRVVVHEEPILRSRFGADWAHYSANVNRWLPRLWPWSADF
jgi:protein-S-isoprenylcysteine O-methyltransferase Ste14